MPRPFSGSCLFGYLHGLPVRPCLYPVHGKADDLWCNKAYRGGRAARRSMLRRRWLWVGLSHSGTRTYAVPAGRAGVVLPAARSFRTHSLLSPALVGWLLASSQHWGRGWVGGPESCWLVLCCM